MFTVYALYSEKYNKIYIGQTSDIIQRLAYHNVTAIKSWTLKYRPWKCIYTEVCNTRADAIRREKQLKSSKGREFIWLKVQGFCSI